MPPGARAGFSMCVHKKRAVLFGGVVDMEAEGYFFVLISYKLFKGAHNIVFVDGHGISSIAGDVLLSMFLNELYGFQLDTQRWYVAVFYVLYDFYL
jgi:prepilin-type processing-associated H-X9-DG protein